ncbi:hypothetical protein GS682_06610 [Nostoc sp. B(2019)]|nr:hypothetical protein [Nostoc sp. B(2019)]
MQRYTSHLGLMPVRSQYQHGKLRNVGEYSYIPNWYQFLFSPLKLSQ